MYKFNGENQWVIFKDLINGFEYVNLSDRVELFYDIGVLAAKQRKETFIT